MLHQLRRHIIFRVMIREFKRHSKRKIKKPKQISSIAILMEQDSSIHQKLKQCLQALGFEPDQMHFMRFSKTMSDEARLEADVFGTHDFSFTGRPSEILQRFVDQDYDILINYFTESNPYLALASLQTSSEFRVGFTAVDPRLNDLIFSLQTKDTAQFCQQMDSYLQVIENT